MNMPAKTGSIGVVVDDANAAFQEAVDEIRKNGNRVSDGLLDSLQRSFERMGALARNLDRFLDPSDFADALEAIRSDAEEVKPNLLTLVKS